MFAVHGNGSPGTTCNKYLSHGRFAEDALNRHFHGAP
jgi:hypothetical protein